MSPKVMSHIIEDILLFWFGDPESPDYGKDRAVWFMKNDAFDAEIKDRFMSVIESAGTAKLDAMAESPEGAVALVVTLDQFPRNVFRDHPRAFATDAKALDIAKQALAKGFDQLVMPMMRKFLYLPFEHSEKLEDQERALDLFGTLGGQDLEWAQKHHIIIARFGRFPHRNAVLGRTSTADEEQFLTEPDSSF